MQALLTPLFELWTDPECRSAMFWWVVVATVAVLVWYLLLGSLQGVCRTSMETAELLALLSWATLKTLVLYVLRGFQPRFLNWTLRFELVQGLVRTTTTKYGDRFFDKRHAQVLRHQSGITGSFLGWFACQQHKLRLETVQFNGLEQLWLKSTPAKAVSADTTRLVVLYYHGGAYAVNCPRAYIAYCSTLVDLIKRDFALKTGGRDITVDVFLANYRKLPEYRYPVPAEDAVTMYEYLLRHEGLQPKQIVLAGDSAGGGLVLSTLLRVRDGKTSGKVELPLAAIVSSPVTDLTNDEDVNEGQHCIISPRLTSACLRQYHPTHHDPSTWADASPVQCDLTGLPPMLVQVGGLEYILQHSTRLAAKAKADGVTNLELDVHENMPHVFTFFPSYVLPYSRVGFQKMAAFAVKQLLAATEDGKVAELRTETETQTTARSIS